MKDNLETPETHDCGGGNLKEPRQSIATMSPGEMEAYAALFIVLLMAGTVTLNPNPPREGLGDSP